MPYRYDLHCHTKEGSKCSDIAATDMAELYYEMGYTGFCITDHFSGMTTLPDDTSWRERVLFHYDIYEKARAAGEKYGLTVFWGIEYSPVYDIKQMSNCIWIDFVVFNLSKEWLIENQSAFCGTDKEQLSNLRKAGGFISHAHPIIYKQDTEQIQLYQNYVDAVEVINGGLSDIDNNAAQQYARAYGLYETAATDIHRYDQRVMAGLETETHNDTIDSLISAIKMQRTKPFSIDRDVNKYWLQIQQGASEARKLV